MQYAVGSLVKARGREWVVLPESTDDFLILRPLGGTDQEIAGIHVALEAGDIGPATFDYPDPARVGDFRSGRLLRDAVRLGFRSSAGPFRSFARLNVEPRPYQLAPLLMALQLDPVRLLIADDVGIGKTVEAGLVARELLDRGEVRRLAVLCPPHLAEQWQKELADKFNIQAELVLSSTVGRLERHTAVGQSLFDLYPFVIVSTEYIKSSRRRDDFIRACPELVIVDEAHGVAFAKDRRSGRHLRHQLVRALSDDPTRHLLLVTATPHSGDEGAFRSLLALLRPEFDRLPADLTGEANEKHRREVARHLIQRRRADIREYMEQTVFPAREEAEETYSLSPDYLRLFNTVLEYAHERILDTTGSRQVQRVRWWSALALLRSLASSPAAAAATLRSRSGTADAATAEDADELGERTVLDLEDAESSEFIDVPPGGQEGEDAPRPQRERLLDYARRADRLAGPDQDLKLRKAIALVRRLLDDGFQPILFCRFIPTAEYVADHLRAALPKGVEVAAVTGTLTPAERALRVAELGDHDRRVLVATDCLSEGINLQEHFNAVIHYDLSWNPTRHEQREGRVDRFGQNAPTIRTITYFGADNQIDGLVLDVLLRKHKQIRSSLGISVPVPANTSDVVQALLNGLLLRGGKVSPQQLLLPIAGLTVADVQLDWDNVTERERQSRTMFAQRSIKVETVAQEWAAMRAAIGTHADVARFVREVVALYGGAATPETKAGAGDVWRLTLPNVKALLQVSGGRDKIRAGFTLPVPDGALYLSRTAPLVEGLAAYTMDTALDPLLEGAAARCSVIRSRAVGKRTALLLLRFRYHIITRRGRTGPLNETPLLAEEALTAAFRGRGEAREWLDDAAAEALLAATPDQNIDVPQQVQTVARVLEELRAMPDEWQRIAAERGAALLDAHQRVRAATRQTGVSYRVEPQLPPDVLGVYVLLPVI
ncbi:MAG: DEAD/DEAH box helicase [Anaerolineae bacterium]|nr:DEAD/DEAH box helicase [Anaerolineae bacterium]